MPELPEIETICSSLEAIVTGQKIDKIDVLDTRLRKAVDVKALKKWGEGFKIVNTSRRAKYILWEIENRAFIVIHLGMSGRLGYFVAENSLEKHTHVIFNLNSGIQIRFRDPRRFGLVGILKPDTQDKIDFERNLGVEPLENEFSLDYLSTRVRTSKTPIKSWIMNSKNVVGVGNIYANEALFYAGIDPQRPACFLTKEEQLKLVQAIKSVLFRAIKMGGTTLNDFRNVSGEPGFFQVELAVYERNGQKCTQCFSTIEKIKLGGRSSYFCPVCQK